MSNPSREASAQLFPAPLAAPRTAPSPMRPRGTVFYHRLPGTGPPREAPGEEDPARLPGPSASLPCLPALSALPPPSQAGSSRRVPSSWTQQGWASHTAPHSELQLRDCG